MTATTDQILDQLKSLTLLEAAELVKQLKKPSASVQRHQLGA